MLRTSEGTWQCRHFRVSRPLTLNYYLSDMKNLLPFLLGGCLLLSVVACKVQVTTKDADTPITAYVGTYTRTEGHVDGKAEGIYRVQLDELNGAISEKTVVAEIPNPSFVKLSADKHYLYAVSELAHADEPTGFVHAFRVKDGALTEISKLPTDGKAPCHLEIDKSGDYLLASNYVGGVAKMYRIAEDGSLTVADKFQVPMDLVPGRSSHLHSAKLSPDNNTVAIADLGLDRIWLFELDTEKGKLVPLEQSFLSLADKAGPRHSVWSVDGRYLYVINELNATVDVIEKAASGDVFKVVQTASTLPEGWTGKNACADIHLHPNGLYLYGSNRGHNSIVVFSVDQTDGRLSLLEHKGTRGDFPRNFAVSPRGKMLWVANQNTSNVSAFKISEKDGTLRFLWDYDVATPVCLEF